MNVISDEHLAKYLSMTSRALEKIRIAIPEEGRLHAAAQDFLNMARAYYSDALHFRDNGDAVSAFACVNYAYGWIDAGARLGLFDTSGDHALFTLSY